MASKKFEIGTTVRLNKNNKVHDMTGRVEIVGRMTVTVRWIDQSVSTCNKRTVEIVEAN